MDGKFFTDETKDNAVKFLDDVTKAGIFEPFDGPGYRILLNQIDKYADKYVPDQYDAKINAAVNLALGEQYEEAAGQLGEVLDDLINIEAVSDDLEKLVFVDGLKFLVRQLLLAIEKKK